MKNYILTLAIFFIVAIPASFGQSIAMPPKKDPFMPQIPVVIKPELPVQETTPRQTTPQPTTRTPTQITPPVVAQKEPPKPPAMTITGIVWNTKRPQAIVNGQVINVGDMISEFTVTKINKQGILLSSGEVEHMIPY